MARILLTTFGSFGDLHPFLAVALELKSRGHQPIVASTVEYQAKVEAAGLCFRPIRIAAQVELTRELMAKVLHPVTGPRFILRQLMMPAVRTAYDDTLAAARDCDLLVTHPLTMTTPAVAESLGLPWVSTQLAPLGFFSPHDPPYIPAGPMLNWTRQLGPQLGPAVCSPFMSLARRSTRHWTGPLLDLRHELGLSRGPNPLFEGGHSPSLVLALFSPLLGRAQPDWPAHAVTTGFAFYDEDGELPPDLAAFFDAGEPPIVFTLGTSAVVDAGEFYHRSARAAQALGRRAVLLTGADPANRPPDLPSTAIAVDYAPFSALFPRACAIVHQGGAGTTSQAMRAGKPMLVMPYAIDQPDNAARVRRLGIARTLTRSQYTVKRATAELGRLLSDRSYAANATTIAAKLAHENGPATAANHIERLLHTLFVPPRNPSAAVILSEVRR